MIFDAYKKMDFSNAQMQIFLISSLMRNAYLSVGKHIVINNFWEFYEKIDE